MENLGSYGIHFPWLWKIWFLTGFIFHGCGKFRFLSDSFSTALENLVSALLAKRLGCTRIVVICNSHRYQSIIRELGFEVALSPRQLAANHLVHLIHKGKFLATQNLSTRDQIEVQEFRVPQHHHSVYLRELKNQPFWPDQDTLIAAILREDQMLRPGGNQTLQPNDRVLVVARHECFERLQSYFETNLE